ncbi:hypothetical protein VTJ04DRAFT_9452 [Mycothermus thermophilus]|uniref:uncharacterized protein n=1 Tax=Humicola insolens TaxID=85995 RepID=UPI0037439B09
MSSADGRASSLVVAQFAISCLIPCRKEQRHHRQPEQTESRYRTLTLGSQLPIVAPIQVVQASRGGPFGAPPARPWGMTTSPTISTNSLPTTSSHTPLETLLLFRAVAHFGLDDSNFTRIADALQANKLLRNAATYDPRRLTPDALRELFLRVVREELAFSGSDKTPGPDGVLSPASKKRRLEPPPLSSLQEARQYLGRIEAAYSRIHDAYVKHAVGEVQQYERNYEALLKEIKDLERSVPEVAAESESKPPQGPNGIQAPGRPKPAVSQNGSSSSPVASPKPPQPTVPLQGRQGTHKTGYLQSFKLRREPHHSNHHLHPQFLQRAFHLGRPLARRPSLHPNHQCLRSAYRNKCHCNQVLVRFKVSTADRCRACLRNHNPEPNSHQPSNLLPRALRLHPSNHNYSQPLRRVLFNNKPSSILHTKGVPLQPQQHPLSQRAKELLDQVPGSRRLNHGHRFRRSYKRQQRHKIFLRFSPAPGPRTPNVGFPIRIAGGSGTKWVSNSTPSTPRPGIELRLGYDDVPSPAYEPTSPVLQFATLPTVKDSQKQEESIETPKAKPGKFQRAHPQPTPATARSAGSQEKQAPQSGAEQELAKIKEEASTPQPTTEAGDTTADESVTGRMQPSRSSKRKRDDFTPTPAQTPRANQIRETLPEGYVPGEGPKLVLWTRSFNKVCGSAMEQIIHHRSANMFAQPIREKDAPGYHKVVKQPQDLKSIRAAINHGNRAAAAAAAALPDGGDPGTSSVWLPRTEDLVPPRSIINSSQLDRELAHMFANAIMYNPDPNHGPGPAFLHDAESDDEEGDGHHHGHQQDSVLGYKVDEFGVVNDARGMFVEVEKLLSELRSAEVRRNVPPSALAAAAAAAAAVAAAANASNAAASGGGPSAGKDGEGDAPAGDDNDSKEKEVATADEKRDEAEEEAEVDGEEDQQPEDAGNEQEPEGSGAAAAKRRRVAKG